MRDLSAHRHCYAGCSPAPWRLWASCCHTPRQSRGLPKTDCAQGFAESMALGVRPRNWTQEACSATDTRAQQPSWCAEQSVWDRRRWTRRSSQTRAAGSTAPEATFAVRQRLLLLPAHARATPHRAFMKATAATSTQLRAPASGTPQRARHRFPTACTPQPLRPLPLPRPRLGPAVVGAVVSPPGCGNT